MFRRLARGLVFGALSFGALLLGAPSFGVLPLGAPSLGALPLGALSFGALSFGAQRVAWADELGAHHSPESLLERQHLVDAKIYPGYAELVVRRELFNAGVKPDEAQLRIDLPSGGVAVGLRTRGHGPSAPWYTGKLLDAELAAAQYRELTGLGAAFLRDPALLYWLDPESVGLQVFPCLPRASQWVEYTLLVPTRYEEGLHVLSVQALGTDELPATWTLRPGDPRDSLIAEQFTLGPGAVVSVTPAASDELRVGLLERAPLPLAGTFASVALDAGRSIVRGSYRSAPRISTVPEGLRLALLLDTSRSMRAGALERYARVLDALVPHFPHAEVALVAFDRAARPVTPGFVAPEDAKKALSHFPRALRNGSELGLGLAAVARLFQGVPESSRRLIVLTDTRTRSSLTSGELERALVPSRALTHWAMLYDSHPSLNVDEEHQLAATVRSTGGLTWLASARAQDDPELARVYEEWARPIRYSVRGLELDGLPFEPEGLPAELPEGEAFAFEELLSTRPRTVRLRAALWGKEVTLGVQSDPSEERRLAAYLAGQGFHSDYELSDREWRGLALRGRAVTPWTSYLALEPGVRPSTAGLVRDGGSGMGSIRLGSIGTISHCSFPGSEPPHLEAHLRQRLVALRRECGAADRALTVTLETTRDEIVAVERLELTPDDPGITRCLTEALWDEELPEEARALPHTTAVLAL